MFRIQSFITGAMFLEFQYPLPVQTPLGPGYAIYARDGGTFENDIFCVVLEESGQIRHFRSDQMTVAENGTFDIKQRKA
jgi:hypothetical protein